MNDDDSIRQRAHDLWDSVRERAYALWEGEGRPEGRDKEHWAAAEKELGGGDDPGLAYGDVEQPGSGHPDPASAAPGAGDQQGDAAPKSDSLPGADFPPEDEETRQRLREAEKALAGQRQ